MSYTQVTYQVVFSTKGRKNAMLDKGQNILYKYIYKTLTNRKCHVYQINGIEDHIHLLFDLHPKIALADLIKDVKISSSKMIKENSLFENWPGWGVGYGAFTYSASLRPKLIQYVKNQKIHHRVETPRDEFIRLLQEHQIEFEEKYII